MKTLSEHRPVAHLAFMLGVGCALVSGCQFGETPPDTSTKDVQGVISSHRPEAPSSLVQPLDLQVSDDMMQRLVGQPDPENMQHFMSDKPILKLDKSREEPSLKFSGELYYDDESDEYLQSIEGGRLDIEIKFEG